MVRSYIWPCWPRSCYSGYPLAGRQKTAVRPLEATKSRHWLFHTFGQKSGHCRLCANTHCSNGTFVDHRRTYTTREAMRTRRRPRKHVVPMRDTCTICYTSYLNSNADEGQFGGSRSTITPAPLSAIRRPQRWTFVRREASRLRCRGSSPPTDVERRGI